MLKLGPLKLKSRVIQSPMAGCSDLAFRLMGRRYGMEFAFLEMVSAEALVRRNRKTLEMLKSTEEDRPLGAQLVGSKPPVMAEAAGMLEAMGFDWIDLNLGCPVPKVIASGSGSHLLREPDLTETILKAMRKNVKKIPFTIKMRVGFTDPSGSEAIEIAKRAETAGVDGITVHGRTRQQGYGGKANWETIGKVKKAVKIPVIGNGDIYSSEDLTDKLTVSGVDGVMIARGALGNPWIYRSLEKTMAGKPAPPPPSFEERKKAALQHLKLEVEIEGEKLGVLKSRKIICWYFKKFPRVARFRDQINRAVTAPEMEHIICQYQ